MPQLPKATGLKKRQAIDHASRTMLMWIVIASVAVSFLLVGAQFLYQQFVYNARVLSVKGEAADTLADNLENIEELKKAFGPLDAGTNPHVNSTTVLDALPRELDTSAFGTSLQQVIAPRSGVTLDTVQFSDGASEVSLADEEDEDSEVLDPEATPREIGVALTVVGNYEQIAAFVRDLQISIRPIKINNMTITGSDANTRAAINLTTYYQPTKGVVIVEEELE